MKALVYTGTNSMEFQERAIPSIQAPSDAIVKMRYGTICGSDLHILKGDVPSVQHGRVLGHEGVGSIVATGSAVPDNAFKNGDSVLISCISTCGVCPKCRKGMGSHCETGGWLLGKDIDGTQAEFGIATIQGGEGSFLEHLLTKSLLVRIPHAATSLYRMPSNLSPRDAVTLSDAFPTGMESGALNARVRPGCSVAIVGAGPVGLAAMLTAKLYSPAHLVVIDMDDKRLEYARSLGADATINPGAPGAMDLLDAQTDGVGFDSVMEAVGVPQVRKVPFASFSNTLSLTNPQTFELCQKIIAPGGSLANVGVHGQKVDFHLDKLWDRNIGGNNPFGYFSL